MLEQIRSLGAFEVVCNSDGSKANSDKQNRLWQILQKQQVLTTETMGSNISLTLEAWEVNQLLLLALFPMFLKSRSIQNEVIL